MILKKIKIDSPTFQAAHKTATTISTRMAFILHQFYEKWHDQMDVNS